MPEAAPVSWPSRCPRKARAPGHLLDGNHKKCAFLNSGRGSRRRERGKSCATALKRIARLALRLHPVAGARGPRRYRRPDRASARTGGVIAAMKGVHPFEEIERFLRGFACSRCHALSVAGLGAERTWCWSSAHDPRAPRHESEGRGGKPRPTSNLAAGWRNGECACCSPI